MRPSELLPGIEKALRQWRLRLAWQRCLYLCAAIAIILLLSGLTALDNAESLWLPAAVLLAGLGQLIFSRAWKRLTTENFLQHLNHRFPEFEESAQLLLLDDADLSVLQQLQRKRVLKVYKTSQTRISGSKPEIKYLFAAGIMVTVIVLMPFVNSFKAMLQPVLTAMESAVTADTKIAADNGLSSNYILITPPEYSGLPGIETEDMNLNILEGSRVQWKLSFGDSAPSYALVLADDRRLPLIADDHGLLQTSATINKTSLYRIVRQKNAIEEHLDGVYSIGVKLDQAPDIRLLEPQYSSVEIAENADPKFKTRALVMDDFGIRDAGILASLAKGSGEAVKFRDLDLEFERSSKTAKGVEFERDWNLVELGMEPGDELYFTVIASDNKQPAANQGRSQTTIVRWLSEDQAGLAAEGIAMDFMPEFFKSQRQIIIDTEQLIKDRKILATEDFTAESYSIGRSQADLKHKYGQYLGDEFDEGPPLHIGESHAEETVEEGHHDDDHQAGQLEKDISITSTADILSRFGHNHGDPEVGPITARNPVALMKRAVSWMWQAERHLMQGEPQLALPFEYEAYKYLKLARQADRIYVKRLGFVPPPVTEERRLSGKLEDISSYSLSADIQLDKSGERRSQTLLNDIYHILSKHSLESNLDINERQVLQELGKLVSFWSQQRPELIKHAATVEKILLANRFELDDCEDCIRNLQSAIWNLIRDPFVDLHFRTAARNGNDDMLNAYQLLLNESSVPVDSGTARGADRP